VTTSGDNTARLWDIWPLLTADTVAYAGIIAFRALSKEERASLFLTEADTPSGPGRMTARVNDPGAMCDRLAGDPFDPHKRAPGLPFNDIDAEEGGSDVPGCRQCGARRRALPLSTPTSSLSLG
jgi:hypothetical protein